MASFEIAGRAFELAPLKLGALRKAAPHIDQINATAGAFDSLEGVTNAARAMIEVLAIGIEKIDSAITADWLEDQLELADMPKLQGAIQALLESSGLAPKGEAKAPSAPPATKGADSTASSDESSTS
jgi:hypothetical protein